CRQPGRTGLRLLIPNAVCCRPIRLHHRLGHLCQRHVRCHPSSRRPRPRCFTTVGHGLTELGGRLGHHPLPSTYCTSLPHGPCLPAQHDASPCCVTGRLIHSS